MKGLVELYRWADGWTMCRPLDLRKTLSEDFPKSTLFPRHLDLDVLLVYILLDETGAFAGHAWLALDIFEDETPGVEHHEIHARFWGDDKRRFRAFYLDMMVPLHKMLAGGGADYSLSTFPLEIDGPTLAMLRDLVFCKLEDLSASYHAQVFKKGVHQQDQADSPGAVVLEEGIRILNSALSVGSSRLHQTGTLYLNVHREKFELRFSNFHMPMVWALEREEFKQRRHWEWIVLESSDRVVGVGHTPLEALSDVQHLVWPADLADDISRLSLGAWLKKWTIPGSSTVDVQMYELLGLRSPVYEENKAFAEWAQALEMDP